LLIITRSLNTPIYLKTFARFSQNPSVSADADCESNSVGR